MRKYRHQKREAEDHRKFRRVHKCIRPKRQEYVVLVFN